MCCGAKRKSIARQNGTALVLLKERGSVYLANSKVFRDSWWSSISFRDSCALAASSIRITSLLEPARIDNSKFAGQTRCGFPDRVEQRPKVMQRVWRSDRRLCYHQTPNMQSVPAKEVSQELRQILASASRVFVLTGAGISAESGVPTFRGGGNTSVWKGMPVEQISSAQMVNRNLSAVWEWFDYRRSLLRQVAPNAGHKAIAAFQDRFERVTLVTQNIDGLHQSAGSRDVIELHGSIWRARCVTCEARFEISRFDARPDACLACGDRVRPDVVLFGELLPSGAFERAAVMAAQCELCIVVGTSALVYPAAGLPNIAREAGAFICEVNPERTPLSDLCDEVVTGKAGDVLPMLITGQS